MKKSVIAVSVSAFVGLAGCSSTGVDNISSYEEVPLSEAPNMPNPEAMQGGAQEVVVFGMEGEDTANIDSIMRSELENHISGAGADIVDRDASSQLEDEVQRAELDGDASYDGPPVADVAIGGDIQRANFGYEYQNARVTDDGDRIPPQCNFSASVNSEIRVYSIPELDVVETLRAEGSARNSVEAGGRGDCRNRSGDSLIQSAAEDAARDQRDAIQNMFAPEGYVESYLLNAEEEDHLFRITLGSDLGAAEGNDAQIVRIEQRESSLTGETSMEESVVAEGIVTEIVNSNSSVIRVDDGDQASEVMVGDTVYQVFETGMIEGFIESF